MQNLGMLAMILLVVGGLNWGLVGLLNTNLVSAILGEGSTLSTLVYALIGISAVYVGLKTFSKAGK
ncbi:MAG: DUF378 domain-containing protein [bacterium]|nr:DUF378 domain-containing protein [bacterium]